MCRVEGFRDKPVCLLPMTAKPFWSWRGLAKLRMDQFTALLDWKWGGHADVGTRSKASRNTAGSFP